MLYCLQLKFSVDSKFVFAQLLMFHTMLYKLASIQFVQIGFVFWFANQMNVHNIYSPHKIIEIEVSI